MSQVTVPSKKSENLSIAAVREGKSWFTGRALHQPHHHSWSSVHSNRSFSLTPSFWSILKEFSDVYSPHMKILWQKFMETDPQTNSNFSKNSPSMVVAMALYLVASEIMYQGYNSSVNSMKIMNKVGVILSVNPRLLYSQAEKPCALSISLILYLWLLLN